MPLTHPLVVAVSDGGDASLVRPSDWNAAHVGSNEWDTVIVKPSNQDVTNSATFIDDNDLQLSVGSGDVWSMVLDLIYAGDSTSGDYKWQVLVSSGTMTGLIFDIESDGTADTVFSNFSRVNGVSSFGTFSLGTDGAGGKRVGRLEMMLRFSAAATFTFQFAQNSATSSTFARTCAGSRLSAKKLA